MTPVRLNDWSGRWGTDPIDSERGDPVSSVAVRSLDGMDLEFRGEIIHWRGPAPFHFVTVPDEQSAAIEHVSSMVTYGWGAIPVKACIGRTDFRTSLFPRGELYLVPVKDAVRRAEKLTLGDVVTVHLHLDT
jgi:uncharacterized protein DUF1905